MNTAATRAAIKRASQQARNAMRELDAQALADLVVLYQDAAEQVKAAIAARADGDNMVPLAQLRDLLRQVEDVLANLGQQRDALLLQGLQDAATLGVRPYTAAGVGATGMAGQAVLGTEAAMRIHTEAVEFVRSFKAADGLTLSDRVWRLDQGAKEALTRAIGRAVVSGWDAQRAARSFMASGQPAPLDVQQRLRAGRVDALQTGADLLVGSETTGGEVWKAQRVMRTEINRAHGTAYMAAAEGTPGFVGFRFLLSPLHPKPDICDLLAAQNLYGLGPGVYPDAKTCPWPAHPNTLSFVVMVFAEELAAVDRNIKGRDGHPDKVLFVSVRSTVLPAHEHIGENRRLTRKAIHDVIQRYGKRLDIPANELHPHAMRHLFGTELQEEDTPTLAIQELMGHADPKSTAVYAQLAMRKKMATVDRAAPLSKMRTPVSELLKRLPR